LKNFEQDIKALILLPSHSGVFEVSINGELVFSKKNLGRHAQAGEIQAIVKARLGRE